MPNDTDPLCVLPAALRPVVREYAERVRQVAGTRALSLSLLGAAAAGTLAPGRHPVHNALVLESIELDLLRQLAQELPRFQQAAIAPPLVITPKYLAASIDTFPLELLEMQQQHLTVFGNDAFTPLAFEETFVRLQCERELKSMVLAMRQAVLSAAGDERRLFQQHPHAADGVLRVLRGLLWLKGQRDARPAAQVIAEIERIVERPLPGLRALLNAHSPPSWADYCALHDDLEALERAADAS